MSWSFSGVGKPMSLLARASAQMTQSKCTEPEETIRAKVLNIFETCLAAFPPEHPVEISASGSQSIDSTKPGIAVNQLTVSIKPLWGFIE